MKVMHDGDKEFTSSGLNFLILDGIKDKQISKGYSQEQGKVEAYNKIIIAVSAIRRIDRWERWYKETPIISHLYNHEREHGAINGMIPAEKFMKCLKSRILLH